MPRLLIAIIGVVILAFTGGVYGAGSRSERLKWEARAAISQAEAEAASSRIMEASAKVTGKIEAEHQAEVERIRVVYRTLYREIPHAITPETDRAFPMPVGLVRLHDAAALGAAPVPDPAVRPDDAASDVAASGLAGAFVDNYETCHRWRAQVIGWQAWYAEQSAAWSSPAQ